MCAVIYHAAELLLLLPDLFVVLYIGTFGELGMRIAQYQVFLLIVLAATVCTKQNLRQYFEVYFTIVF